LDKEARLILQFDAQDTELLNGLNELHRADAVVIVKIEKDYDPK